ncbi:hypothetical protein GJ496_005399 [Pomphorhynchus laevis]|nr:hypothetical protein GJ496_005399 [Pomphorhynchus laevis]
MKLLKSYPQPQMKYDSTTAILNYNGRQLLTSGYDCRVRAWDIVGPDSTLLIPSQKGEHGVYRSSLLNNDIPIVEETISSSISSDAAGSLNNCYLHCNFVSDMINIVDNQGDTILATVAMDGLLKLWRPRKQFHI